MAKTANTEAPSPLHPDPAGYELDARARGGRIIEQSETPAGFIATTWEFGASDDAYNEIVYTTEPFADDADPSPAPVMPPAELAAAAIEAALSVDSDRADNTQYTNPLRQQLNEQSDYYGREIARLARLTESAMRAQSAIHNALSSLDRDEV